MDLESLVRSIGDHVREAVFIARPDPTDGAIMRLVWVNRAFTRITGYASEAAIGRTAGMLTGENTDPLDHAHVIRRLQRWEEFEADLRLERADGTGYWARLTFRPVPEGEGGPAVFWICLFDDISDRQADAVRLSDLSHVAQHTRDMVCLLDAERRVRWANRSCISECGYDFAELEARRLSELLRASGADEAVIAALEARLGRGLHGHGEVLSRRKDGSLFIAAYEYQPVRDRQGRVEKWICLFRDITLRRTLEARYKAVFDETDSCISIKADGRFVMVNRRFAESCGLTPDEISGRKAADIMDPDRFAADVAVEQHVANTGRPMLWERTSGLPDGRRRHEACKTFRVFEPVTARHLMCAVASDITAIREGQQRLRDSRSAARDARMRLWGAIEAIPDGFVIYDAEDRIAMFNEAYRRVHGALGPRLSVGMRFEDVLREGLACGAWDTGGMPDEVWLTHHMELRETEMARGSYIRLASGRWLLAREVTLDNGERAGVRVDATEMKQREQALRSAQQEAALAQARLEAAISAVNDSIEIYDADDRRVPTGQDAASDGALPTFREELEEGLAHGRFLEALGREAEWLEERLTAHRNPKEPFIKKLTDGRVYRVIERKTPHGDTVTMRFDITNEREQQRRLKEYASELERSKRLLEVRNEEMSAVQGELIHASLHDALTGLPNRRFLQRELASRACEALELHKPMAALHVDLDRFKQINDAFGHAAGDHVLCHVAEVLRREIGPDDMAARVGGDEFVVLTAPGTDAVQLERLAERLIGALKKPLRFGAVECRFGASIGIAFQEMSGLSADPEQMLIDADIALYRAKARGRNRWTFFTEALQQEALQAKRQSDDLLRALDRDEFVTLYQPQFRASDMSVVGVEALLRWAHPSRGLIEPHNFLEAARDLNIEPNLDAMVFSQVIADTARWRAAGVRVPRISLNVCDQRLRDPGLIEDIRGSGIDPKELSIEILETVFADNEDEVLAWNLDQLRDMGVSIELDDFGSGHSSILGLLRFRPRRLKIDRRFVARSLGAADDIALIRPMVEIGRLLGVEIVAEGIETPEQGVILGSLGCDILQGFGCAAPMSAAELAEFIPLHGCARQGAKV